MVVTFAVVGLAPFVIDLDKEYMDLMVSDHSNALCAGHACEDCSPTSEATLKRFGLRITTNDTVGLDALPRQKHPALGIPSLLSGVISPYHPPRAEESKEMTSLRKITWVVSDSTVARVLT
jgi:hypothetical protein